MGEPAVSIDMNPAPMNDVAPTPSERIIKDATKESVITDAKGRKLTVGRYDFIAEVDMAEALGKHSSNVALVSMAQMLLYLKAIDGERIGVPGSYPEMRALWSTLGNEGMQAIGKWVEDVLIPANAEVSYDRVKNS